MTGGREGIPTVCCDVVEKFDGRGRERISQSRKGRDSGKMSKRWKAMITRCASPP